MRRLIVVPRLFYWTGPSREVERGNGTDQTAGGHARAVPRRWLSLSTAAVTAAGATLALGFVFRRDLQRLDDVPLWLLGVVAFCLVATATFHWWERLPAVLGARHPVAYPPLWVAGTFGAGLALGLPALFGPIARTLGLATTAHQLAAVGSAYVLGSALILGVFAAARRLRRRGAAPLPAKRGLALASFDDLRKWVKTDEPVESEVDDAFGLSAVADRVARRLLVESPSAQAIVGPFGSGKSSILKLVGERLERRPGAARIRLVPVPLWPFDNARAAVEGTIQALIDKVGEEVDVVALRGLPEAYVEAMSAASGWIGAIARLQPVRSPKETLLSIDRVAIATGLQFVVWIEDLERFAGRSEDAEEKLNPIRALLYGLDELVAVTIVTATVDLRLRFDLEKIARFVEEVPRLPEAGVERILATFREGCRTLSGYVDPASTAARGELDRLATEDRGALGLLGLLRHQIVDALPEICATPRTLKQAMRACLDVWQELLGEIDFDDVLVISVLREGQPDAFALLQRYLPYWRGLGPREEKESREVRSAWETGLMSAVPQERTRKAVKLAVEFVFEPAHNKPQGLRQHAHCDYWLRYLTREPPPASQRDQRVLQALAKGADADIVGLLADPAAAGAVEDFSAMLETDRVLRLLVPVAEHAARTSPSAWGGPNPPGVVPLWRIWLTRVRAGKFPLVEAVARVKQAYDASVSTSPAVAAQIEHYFVVADATVADIIGRDNRETTRVYLRQALLRAYRGKPRALAQNLAGAAANVLRWLTWGHDRARAGEPAEVPFVGWEEFATLVVDATAAAPSDMLSQLACLVVRRAESFGGRVTYTFDPELARALFGDPERILALFEQADPADWAEEGHVLAVFRAAGKVAPDPVRAGDDDDD